MEPSPSTPSAPARPVWAVSAVWAGWVRVCLRDLKVGLVSPPQTHSSVLSRIPLNANPLPNFLRSSPKLCRNCDWRAETEQPWCVGSTWGAGRASFCLHSWVPLPTATSVFWGRDRWNCEKTHFTWCHENNVVVFFDSRLIQIQITPATQRSAGLMPVHRVEWFSWMYPRAVRGFWKGTCLRGFSLFTFL